MYLWKYWRETRIVFIGSLACIGLVLALILRSHVVGQGQIALLPFMVIFQVLPVAFVAWLFGSFGVGRDLGDKSGSYLLTRPRKRAFFVWSDWGHGMAQLLVIVSALNVVLGVLLQKVFAGGGEVITSIIVFPAHETTIALLVLLNVTVVFLAAALVFSLTYFSAVLVKHSKGLILGVGILLGYQILKVVVERYWPGVHLPDLLVLPLRFSSAANPRGLGLADHFALSVALRAAVVLLFPFAAKLVLEKTDIA